MAVGAKPYSQLARKMTIIALLVALVPLNLLGAAIYSYFTISHEERVKEELRRLSANRASSVQLFLDERTALLEILVNTAPMDDLLSPGRLQQVFAMLNRRSWTFLDLGIIDKDGDHLVYVGPYTLEHQNYKDAYWFQQTMTRGVYVSDVFLGLRGVPHFVIAVKKNDGDRSWILRATIDSDVFNNLVRRAQVGASGDAFIVNRDGRYQTPSRFGGTVMDTSDLDLKAAPPGISVISRNTPRGQLLTSMAWLSKEDWLLVIEQDAGEGLGVLATARNMEAAILGLGSLMIVLAVLFLVRFFIRHLESIDKQRAGIDAQLVHSARLVSLGRMAAGVAHEINNPLAAIGEMAGLMDDLMDDEFVQGTPRGGKFKENVAKIQHHVDRARTVTHRLLGFARRMEPHLDAVDVGDVVKETCSFMDKEAVFRNVELTTEMEPNLPRIRTDRAQLQQVFLNLLNNAIDAVGEGGHIKFGCQVVGDHVVVSVADDGPGIPKDVAERIFDPFFTTKAPGQGTGLGLSISHSIMQKLGGDLTFESQTGHGATFFVHIPKVLAEAK
jgi:two-component system, NtrC family, sensor kinase